MATGGSNPGSHSRDHYTTLGVLFTSTGEEIRKVFLRKARLYHPDKNESSNAEEIMKRMNKAYSILSDQVQRQKYDEQLENDKDSTSTPLRALSHGSKASQEYIELFQSRLHFNISLIKGRGMFERSLRTKVPEFLNTRFRQLLHFSFYQDAQEVQPKEKDSSLFLQDTHVLVEQFIDGLSVPHIEEYEKALATIMHHLRTGASSTLDASYKEGSVVPIIDLNTLNAMELHVLVSIFSGVPISKIMYAKDAIAFLKPFLPMVKVMNLTKTKLSHACTICNKSLYNMSEKIDNTYKLMRLPRFGYTKPQSVCNTCQKQYFHDDMDDWIKNGQQMFKQNGIKKIHEAIGCFVMALCSNPENCQPLLILEKELLELNLPQLALLLIPASGQSSNSKLAIRNGIIASTVLKDLSMLPIFQWYEEWILLLAAKNACQSAKKLVNEICEAPKIQVNESEIETALETLTKRKKSDFDNEVTKVLSEINDNWYNKNLKSIFKIVTRKQDKLLISFFKGKDYIVIALAKFVKSQKPHFQSMSRPDQCLILFLEGLLEIHAGAISQGMKQIESSVWGDPSNQILVNAAIEITLVTLNTNKTAAMLFSNLYCLVQDLGSNYRKLKQIIMKDQSILFLPKLEELNPPFNMQWPDLIVPSRSQQVRLIRRYERSINEQLGAKKLTEYEAALAYIDFLPSCTHKAELAMCFITASCWLLKGIRKLSLDAKLNSQYAYAYKSILFKSLEGAIATSHLLLHPGMKLYVFRIVLAIALYVTAMTPEISTDKDAEFISNVLSSLTYNCRLSPFWSAPLVPISEATLLDIFLGSIHCKFIQGLEDVKEDNQPIQKSELLYHLYENNLTHLSHLETVSECGTTRAEVMAAMLDEKGWSFEHVAQKMSSCLSPRDSEGWLRQQNKLGLKMEYAALVGFTIDTKTGSIELLVQHATHDKVGLFSQQDVDIVLSLDSDKCLPAFFSLDPPDPNKRFHPFQEMRFEPKGIDNTDILHTLFETDYLLKSFSVGCDVSSNTSGPFHLKSCQDSLLTNLPESLKTVLKPVSERGNTHSRFSRFWIQADEIVLDESHKGDTFEFRFSSPKMTIRTHPLVPNEDGDLKDTEKPEDPNSPEALFSKDLTDNYHIIGKYFPMFNRLQELVKLFFLPMFIGAITKMLKQNTERGNILIPQDVLKMEQEENKREQKRNVKTLLAKIISPIHDYSPLGDRQSRSSVARHIATAMIDALPGSPLSKSILESHINNWLCEKYTNTTFSYYLTFAEDRLIDYIIGSNIPRPTEDELRDAIHRHYFDMFPKFNANVEELKMAKRRTASKLRKLNECNWVPAALVQSQHGEYLHLCYGGILIAPNVRRGYVQPVLASRVAIKTYTPIKYADHSKQKYEVFTARNEKVGQENKTGQGGRWQNKRKQKVKCEILNAARSSPQLGESDDEDAEDDDDSIMSLDYEWTCIIMNKCKKISPSVRQDKIFNRAFLHALSSGDSTNITWRSEVPDSKLPEILRKVTCNGSLNSTEEKGTIKHNALLRYLVTILNMLVCKGQSPDPAYSIISEPTNPASCSQNAKISTPSHRPETNTNFYLPCNFSSTLTLAEEQPTTTGPDITSTFTVQQPNVNHEPSTYRLGHAVGANSIRHDASTMTHRTRTSVDVTSEVKPLSEVTQDQSTVPAINSILHEATTVTKPEVSFTNAKSTKLNFSSTTKAMPTTTKVLHMPSHPTTILDGVDTSPKKYPTSIGHDSGPGVKPSEPIYNAKAEAQIKTIEKAEEKTENAKPQTNKCRVR